MSGHRTWCRCGGPSPGFACLPGGSPPPCLLPLPGPWCKRTAAANVTNICNKQQTLEQPSVQLDAHRVDCYTLSKVISKGQ